MNCPRCSGLVITQYGETRCLLCGYYKNDHIPDAIIVSTKCMDCQARPVPGKMRCQEHLDYQHQYRLCEACVEHNAMKGRRLCIDCHGKKIKEGFARARAL